MSIESAIELLRKVITLNEFERMNRSTVKGFIGELLVKAWLKREGIDAEHLGNQSGYDLEFNYAGRPFRIDVKMSMPKDEFGWGFDCWGWALKHANRKKSISATHLICIGCDHKANIEEAYVVPAETIELFPAGFRQFSKIQHGFVVPCAPPQKDINPPSDDLYVESQRLLNDRTIIRVKAHERLLDACAIQSS
jgi:hypothetical protein